ncbi:MAG: DUF1549 domain-containing protein, partial [Planctomycetes bacterium]|nr:DUF1549 domain-containing protein [Planctomycetota bacterium]
MFPVEDLQTALPTPTNVAWAASFLGKQARSWSAWQKRSICPPAPHTCLQHSLRPRKIEEPFPYLTSTHPPIDCLVLPPGHGQGLALNPQADRATLIRRVAFDLTGLPPTPDEIDAFRRDSSPRADEHMINRYLASPHYGERWGRHWLDAAGYADSNGYFHADTDRPLAYKYRDYVVRAINADKPFDR